jgi:carboxyl-terminal processing protease
MTRATLPLPALFALLVALAAASSASAAGPKVDGAELIKEVVLSLHASSVYPPPPDKLAFSGIKALRSKSPCLKVDRRSSELRVSCNGRSETIAWPPKDGRAVVDALQATLRVIDTRGVIDPAKARFVSRAVANSLRDPYTAYLDPETVAKLDTTLRSRLATPGLELSPRDPQLVRETRPGSDAAKEGLKEGDKVIAVDGTPAELMTYVEINSALTGPTGTTVRLDVRSAQADGKLGPQRSVILGRDLVPEPLVNSYTLGDDGVYVRVSSFAPGVARGVAEAIWERRAKKVVLDLRHNPGGLIHEGAALLDLFFSEGATGGVRPREGRPGQEFTASHQPTDTAAELVVLIDGGTASASELVSMVLKERGRAVIIGSPSIGKGSVQKIIRMPDGGALRVTSAYYTGATGQPLPLVGVRPDRYLAPPSGRTVLEGGDPSNDGWVLSALDVLEGGTKVSGRSTKRSFYGPLP